MTSAGTGIRSIGLLAEAALNSLGWTPFLKVFRRMHTFLVTSNSVKKAGKFKKDLPKMVGFFSTRDNLPTRKKARGDNPQTIWVILPN